MDADVSKLPLKAVRINITMPECVRAAADRFAEERGMPRSGLLVRAVSELMTEQKAGHHR